MSKHIGRKQRWVQNDSRRFTSDLGRVQYEKGAWYAFFSYRARLPDKEPSALASWTEQAVRLGPFKRPRDAQVALERETTMLRNRLGGEVLFGDELWGEMPGK